VKEVVLPEVSVIFQGNEKKTVRKEEEGFNCVFYTASPMVAGFSFVVFITLQLPKQWRVFYWNKNCLCQYFLIPNDKAIFKTV
jgi:hypothetical protein